MAAIATTCHQLKYAVIKWKYQLKKLPSWKSGSASECTYLWCSWCLVINFLKGNTAYSRVHTCPIKLFTALLRETVPCMASCAVINKPVYKCICTSSIIYVSGFLKLTCQRIKKIAFTTQQAITIKATNIPLLDNVRIALLFEFMTRFDNLELWFYIGCMQLMHLLIMSHYNG